MSKGKLAKFADMERYENVFQYPYSVIDNVPFDMKGKWGEQYFKNNNPIVLELGCGKGEYTVGLAKLFPDVNFIGVDIKGSRMWTGATQALNEGLDNVPFEMKGRWREMYFKNDNPIVLELGCGKGEYTVGLA